MSHYIAHSTDETRDSLDRPNFISVALAPAVLAGPVVAIPIVIVPLVTVRYAPLIGAHLVRSRHCRHSLMLKSSCGFDRHIGMLSVPITAVGN